MNDQRDPELPPSYRDWRHYAQVCSDTAAHHRERAAVQMRLRVEADQRSGKKNVAALEARIVQLEDELAAVKFDRDSWRVIASLG